MVSIAQSLTDMTESVTTTFLYVESVMYKYIFLWNKKNFPWLKKILNWSYDLKNWTGNTFSFYFLQVCILQLLWMLRPSIRTTWVVNFDTMSTKHSDLIIYKQKQRKGVAILSNILTFSWKPMGYCCKNFQNYLYFPSTHQKTSIC